MYIECYVTNLIIFVHVSSHSRWRSIRRSPVRNGTGDGALQHQQLAAPPGDPDSPKQGQAARRQASHRPLGVQGMFSAPMFWKSVNK